jgi:radical SAM protein with 4Fe4S-binding SPASM domain
MVNTLRHYSLMAMNVLLKPSYAIGLPKHIQVEITTFCNMNCLSCGRRYIVEKPQHMHFEDLKKIYDEIMPKNINLSGLGEPLLNPDIFKMIRYCKEGGSIVNFPTNLNVSSGHIERLVESGPQQIKVSIDSASAGAYQTVRHANTFNKVCKNISYINTLKYRQRLQYPEIRFNFALQKANVAELPELLSLAADLNVKVVYIQDLNYFSVENEKERLCKIDRGYLKEILDNSERIAAEKDIQTNIANWKRHFESLYNKMLPKEEFEPNSVTCMFPWVSSFVNVSGDVKLCPVFVWEKDSESMGNCLEEPFARIWNSEKYRNARRSFKKKQRCFAICKRCVPPNLFDMRLIWEKMLLRS